MSRERKEAMAVNRRSLEQAIHSAREHLLSRQDAAGYWVGKLESDVSVTAGYVPFMRYLGIDVPERTEQVVYVLRSTQLPDGGWSSYPGGQGNLDVSIQAYLSLKVAGHTLAEPFMQRARDFVLSHGGVERANTFTHILLALFGQFDWARLPMLPPELILLPSFFPLNIYDFASWARATIVALTVVMACRPICPLADDEGIGELYTGSGARKRSRVDAWGLFFLAADRLLKMWEPVPLKPWRPWALRRAERWIVAHQEVDGSWGGIMLPWLYSLVALKCRGYSNDHPVMARGIAGLEDFIEDEGPAMLLQPAGSPVWDTAYTVIALRRAGLPPDHPALVRAARWLLGQQVLVKGDWQVKRPHTRPGAWAFEFENDLYPDIDDSSLVPMALDLVETPEEGHKAQAIELAVDWVLAMQSKNGGWGAFDVDNDKEMLAHIPFADFMTPLDPVSADVTAHVVELLARLEYSRDHPALRRALGYLYGEQEEDGSWYGRWGVNYVYGTGAVLAALREVGDDPQAERIRKAVHWLKEHQNDDGGWGETCRSYEDASYHGVGPSTASQTAWALLGLLAAGEKQDAAVTWGVEYLLQTQRQDGGWDEEAFTGTGFPRAFYLRYHMYPLHFPLMALARYKEATLERRDRHDGKGEHEGPGEDRSGGTRTAPPSLSASEPNVRGQVLEKGDGLPA